MVGYILLLKASPPISDLSLVRDSHNLRATFHSILQFDSSRWLGSALDGGGNVLNKDFTLIS